MKIEHNTASTNYANRFGGGIFIDRSVVEVSNSTLRYNKCDFGGGIYIGATNVLLKSLLINNIF